MRVFVTGATGWIGSAVLPELIGAGHQVTGLARSEASAAALAAAGAAAHRGTLDDLGSLRSAAAASDGVIHLAFKHDIAFSGGFQNAADADRRAVEAFGEALAGSGRPLIIASGTLGLAPGQVATERDGHGTGPAVAALGAGPRTRLATAELVLSLASRGVRSSVMRLPPTVHGDGDNGFLAALVGIARDKRVSGYLGDGTNRWPAVHRLDAAHLFRLALEKAPAGSTLHAIADQGVPIRDIAEVVGRQLHLPVAAIAPEDAAGHFAWLAGFLGADSPASSTLTRQLLGWHPDQPGLIDDLNKGHYFHTTAA
jgi:nucleoside-diphosphate-sugar epimerase